MTECQELIDIVKQNSIESIFNWINRNCECKICNRYNVLFNLLEDKKTFLSNEHFKKINLTENMKKLINKELQNKLTKQKIFKLFKK